MSSLQSWFEPPRSPSPETGQPPNLDFDKMNPDTIPDASEELLTRRVHILGTGSIGMLTAHSLRILPNPPPITLLLHRPELYDDFKKGNRIVRLVNNNTNVNDEQTGFDVDVLEEEDGVKKWRHYPHYLDGRGTEPLNPLTESEKLENGEPLIYTLIVTVKGPSTEAALNSVKHRIDSRTTILLMQNGMGQVDILNQKVFIDPTTRPTYMLGIISHGCYMQGPFAVIHAGFGSVALGICRDTDKYPLPPKGSETNTSNLSDAERKAMFPSEKDLYSNLSSRYLLRTLTRSPVLACAAYPYLDLFQLQLEKLVSNCLLNPLTALLNVQNGAMLNNQPLTRIHRLLIAEISLVIRSLPELEGLPNARLRFSPARLESFFRGICTRTAKNSSSMREDVRKMKLTEIDFLNGYIVKRGEELGIKCVLNYMLMQLIKAKSHLNLTENNVLEPYGTSDVTAMREGDAVVLEDVSGPAR